MPVKLRHFLKGSILAVRPTVLVAALLVVVAATFVVAALLHEARQPASSPATAQDIDPAQAAALFADAFGVVDTDRDGLSDAAENFVYGTDPDNATTAGTRIPDGWLVTYGYDAFTAIAETMPAAVPPLSKMPPAYDNRWPAAFTASLWDIYAFGRPGNWSEKAQGPFDSGLDPTDWDQNDDGIADGYLLRYGLDPLDGSVGDKRLAGSEGLTVREAFEHGTDPRSVDTDLDGVLDRDEIAGPVAPNGERFTPTNPVRLDTAGSGVCDGYLIAHGLDPSKAKFALDDLDSDGATTREEYNWSASKFSAASVCKGGLGLSPTKSDSGGSGLPDGWLIRYGLDPLEAGIADRETQDWESDPSPTLPSEDPTCPPVSPVRLSVRDEYVRGRPVDWDEQKSGPWWGGTNPSQDDSDGDGIGDARELAGYCVHVVTDPIRNATVAYRVSSNPSTADSDEDGLTDAQEAAPSLRTGLVKNVGVLDPSRRDTDFDGISDGEEADLNLGLDPTRADSAYDLLRDGKRLALLQERALQDGLDSGAAYRFPGDPQLSRTVAQVAQAQPGWPATPGSTSAERISRLYGPGGDVDADGIPNVVDRDADGDGLLNGWESQPALYEFSSFGLGPFQARAESDFLNAETDGDQLSDGWELRFGQPDALARDFNLNPAKWDSDVPPDGQGDGAEDPDRDSIDWYSFDGEGNQAVKRSHSFVFNNLAEQQYGTDPNRFDSDGDGLADGWKVFWGVVYPTLGAQERGSVYPGAPGPFAPPVQFQPQLKTPQGSVVLSNIDYYRLVLDVARGGPEEQWEPPAFENIPASGGSSTRTVYRLRGSSTFGFLDVQEARTNPYVADTDGDGMPDAWERLHRAPITDPSLLGDCVTAPTPSPIEPDALIDLDADGLTNIEEYASGGDPLCPDTDLGGIKDGDEETFGRLLPADPTNDRDLFRDSRVDSDCDGIPDSRELLGFKASWRTDVTRGFKTDPHNPDTDGDGLLDGTNIPESGGFPDSHECARYFFDLGIAYQQLGNSNFEFYGESGSAVEKFSCNPTNPRDGPAGVPAGWLVAHRQNPQSGDSAFLPYYGFAKPGFWDEQVHGPWWGGADPGTTIGADTARTDLTTLQSDPDPDRDQLVDTDGGDPYEDPLPGANGENAFRALDKPSGPMLDSSIRYPTAATDPANESHPPLERRLKAQAYVNNRFLGVHYIQYRAPDTEEREAPCITMDSTERLVLRKGETHLLQGVVRRCGTTVGVPGLTVEARMGEPSQAFGAAVTNATGGFVIPFNVSSANLLELPPGSLVFRGATNGTVHWNPNPASAAPGPNVLVVRTYATPGRSLLFPTAPNPPLAAARTFLDGDLHAGTVVVGSLPDVVVTGGSFDLVLQESDSGGTPQSDPIVVTWDGTTRRVVPGATGQAVFSLPAPHRLAGDQVLQVVTEPRPSTSGFVSRADTTFTVELRSPVQVRIGAVASPIDAGSTLSVSGTVSGPVGPIPNLDVAVSLERGGVVRQRQTAQTGELGGFATQLPVPENARSGVYLVRVSVAASSLSLEGFNETTMLVRSIPVFANVDVSNVTLGSPATVAGRLLEPDGTAIAGARVSVSLGGIRNQTITDEDGNFAARIPGIRTRGLVDQRLEFLEDGTHVGAERVDQRLVVSGSRLILGPGETPRGGTAEIPVVLQDANGAPIVGAVVRITWGTDPVVSRLTGDTGIALFTREIPAETSLGQVAIRAEFGGSRDASIGPSSNLTLWRVTDGLLIEASNVRYTAGTPGPVGTLVDPIRRTPLAGLPVRLFHSNASQPEEKVTDGKGRFPLEPSLGAAAEPFRDELRILFPGDDNFGPSERRVVVELVSPVNLTVAAPASLVSGTHGALWVRLVDARGIAVSDGLVSARIGDVVLASARPENGTARLEFAVPTVLASGPGVVEVVYSGSVIHQEASSQSAVRLLSSIQLRVDVHPARAGNTAIITVAATDAAGPLRGAALTVHVASLSFGVRGETDSEGIAQFRVPQPDTASGFVVRFEGNETVAAAGTGGTMAPLTVLQAAAKGLGALVYVLQGAVVLLVLAGLLLLQLRRHPMSPSLGRARRVLRGRGPIETRILRAYQILQDAAISAELLDGPAPTPGLLGDALASRIPESAWPALDQLISLFEDARYGVVRMTPTHRAQAMSALDALIDAFSRFNPIWGRPPAAPSGTLT